MIELVGDSLYQWERDREVIVDNPEGNINEVHFAKEGDSVALVVKPSILEDNTLIAKIPNIFLQHQFRICVYAVHCGAEKEKTIESAYFPVTKRPRPADYVYTETEAFSYKALEEKIEALSDQVNNLNKNIDKAVEDYLKDNPVEIETDESLIYKDGKLSVNVTDKAVEDNSLPISSAAVNTIVGNIDVILGTL